MSSYIEYNFPASRFVEENTLADQLEHVLSECREIIAAVEDVYEDLAEAVKDPHVLEELADKYHSLETFFRRLEKEQGSSAVPGLFCRVEEKNRLRGYYEAAPTQSPEPRA